jgi:predicted methyltransferase
MTRPVPGTASLITSDLLAQVAAAVDLREGPAAVRTLVREVARRQPVAVRDLARAVALPVPIVSALCAELRAEGVISEERPVQLTEQAALEVGPSAGPDVGVCPICHGLGHVVPDDLWPVIDRQAAAEAASPRVRVELDQAHCTPETAVRRALLLADAGALEGGSVLLLGDDDLLSVAIGSVSAHLGLAGPDRLVVLDVDADLVEFLASYRAQGDGGGSFEARVHDLRDPIPGDLAGSFTTAVTDPPYTVAGATLFGSRAAQGLAPAPGGDVFLSFGSTRPDVIGAAQAALVTMGFTIRSLVPDFNHYLGTGALAGTSAMYQLRTAGPLAPAMAGRYDGDLYTSTGRDRPRRYTCRDCGRDHLVGPGEAHQTVGELIDAGCDCGGTTFDARARVDRPEGQSVSSS